MNIEPREYQKNIYKNIKEQGNTLVILPTGLGKTLIGFMFIKEKLKNGLSLFLAPTKPLVKQHYTSFLEIMDVEKDNVTIVTGEIPKKIRKELYSSKKIFFSTPQTIKNDIISNTFSNFDEIALCVFDEAHRAMGEYAYTKIAEKIKNKALIIGLTASPGGNQEHINKILSNLFIKNIQIRTKDDEDVKNYVKDMEITWFETPLSPELNEIKTNLEKLISFYAKKLTSLGVSPQLTSKKRFIEQKQKILTIPSKIKYPLLITHAVLFNLLYMEELVETQGASILKKYLEKLEKKTTKSAAILSKNPIISKIKKILLTTEQEHPKLELLLNILNELKNQKIIVFAHYREQAMLIENKLQAKGFSARIFLGKRDAYTKKQQEETIIDFRKGLFNILIASSVGEEGIDLPSVDAVVFYEPVASEIRAIQRRGRTGRVKQGKVYVLITKGTRDEYFHWASIARERNMRKIITKLQKRIEKPPEKQNKPSQLSLKDF